MIQSMRPLRRANLTNSPVRVQIQLFHDAAAMGFYGVDAQVQRGGDFLIGFSFGDHLQHLALAGGEQVERITDVAAIVGEHGVRNGRAEIAFTFRDGADCRDQIRVGGILQQVSACAGAQDFADVDGVLMHAEGEHAGARGGCNQSTGRLDAVQLRHGDVHQHHVGLKFFAGFDGFPAVGGLADDLHVGLRRQNHLEALPDQHVVVGQ